MKLKIIRYSALLAGVSAILAPPVLAQERNLDRESSDVRVFQGRVDGEAAVFTVSIPAGQSMLIDVTATDGLDPILRVKDARTGELIGEDDDGGGGLNSRLRVAGERGRRIRIEVDSYDSEWAEPGEGFGGSFDLRLALRDQSVNRTRAVSYGARETGSIEDEEHLFTIAGRAGELVEIALLSGDDALLDPYLALRNPAGEEVASNDDSNGLNSMIRYTFETSGTYTIAASGFSGSTGDYVLRVRERREVRAQVPQQVIGIGDEASGELTSSWSELGDVAPAHNDYRLSEAARAAIRNGNGQVTIRMTAGEGGDPDFGGSLDPYLEVGFETPLGFAMVDSDDDGAGALNSLLPIDLSALADQPGMLDMLRIRAQAFGSSSGGYTLTITEGLEERVAPSWEAAEEILDWEGEEPVPMTVPPPPPVRISPPPPAPPPIRPRD